MAADQNRNLKRIPSQGDKEASSSPSSSSVDVIGGRYQILDKLTKSKQSNIFSVVDQKTDEM